MDFSDLIQWCLEHLSYWVILILMILENSLVPLPSELIVTPAAYKAANGEMNIFLVILFTTLGALIGAAVRQFISIPAGLARMRLPAFILFTTLGSAIWNSILVLLGYYLAQILPEDRLLEELERYSREISYVFVALVTLALITWYLKRKLKACR